MGVPSEIHKKSISIILESVDVMLDSRPATDKRNTIMLRLLNASVDEARNTPALWAEHCSLKARVDALVSPGPKAPDWFEAADALWQNVPETPISVRERMYENKFYWFRESVAQETPTFEVYRDLLSSDWVSRSQRTRAMLLYYLGKNWIPVDIHIGSWLASRQA